MLILQYKTGTPPAVVQLLGESRQSPSNPPLNYTNLVYTFKSDGTVVYTYDEDSLDGGTLTNTTIDPWYIAGSTPGIGSDYQISYTITGGNTNDYENILGSGAGTGAERNLGIYNLIADNTDDNASDGWETMNVDRSFGIERYNNADAIVFSVSIRDVATSTVQATNDYLLRVVTGPV